VRIFAFLTLALTVSSSRPSDAHAQQAMPAPGGPTTQALAREREMARRVPVTVALVAALPAPDSVPAVILRRRDVSCFGGIGLTVHSSQRRFCTCSYCANARAIRPASAAPSGCPPPELPLVPGSERSRSGPRGWWADSGRLCHATFPA
jgi:hypothetical protein